MKSGQDDSVVDVPYPVGVVGDTRSQKFVCSLLGMSRLVEGIHGSYALEDPSMIFLESVVFLQ